MWTIIVLNAAFFLKKFAVHDITEGLPGILESYPGLAKYVWNSKNTPLLANFLSRGLLIMDLMVYIWTVMCSQVRLILIIVLKEEGLIFFESESYLRY